MRNSAQYANVKPDYLVRLETNWYRGDTNPGYSDAFISAACLSGAAEPLFEREERFDALSRAHLASLAAIDHHLARARARVVIRRHCHRVGARRQDREQVARLHYEIAPFPQHVGGLAHRAHDVVARGCDGPLLHCHDLVP